MAWDELGKTLNTFVEERLLSPLLATFVVSWSIWNYKFLVILFSLHSVPTTFKLIAVEFPDWQTRVLWGFVYPMLTTLLYLYVYPWFAAKALEQWKKSQLELTKIRRKYDDETPVSQAEAREIRAARYKAEEELEKARSDLASMRRDLIALRQDQPEVAGGVSAENAQAKAAAQVEEARRTITTLLADAEKRAMSIIDEAKARATDEGNKIIQTAKEEADKQLHGIDAASAEQREGLLPQRMRQVFEVFEQRGGGPVELSPLLGALGVNGINKMEASYLLAEMAESGLLKEDERTGGFSTTQQGLRAYYASKTVS